MTKKILDSRKKLGWAMNLSVVILHRTWSIFKQEQTILSKWGGTDFESASSGNQFSRYAKRSAAKSRIRDQHRRSSSWESAVKSCLASQIADTTFNALLSAAKKTMRKYHVVEFELGVYTSAELWRGNFACKKRFPEYAVQQRYCKIADTQVEPLNGE